MENMFYGQHTYCNVVWLRISIYVYCDSVVFVLLQIKYFAEFCRKVSYGFTSLDIDLLQSVILDNGTVFI